MGIALSDHCGVTCTLQKTVTVREQVIYVDLTEVD